MGLRLRLKASYDVSGFTGQARVVLNALRRYGISSLELLRFSAGRRAAFYRQAIEGETG